jgi:hypothetical protein
MSKSIQGGITQERLKELFNLDPETGILYWKARVCQGWHMEPGAVAGCISVYGYWLVRVDGRRYPRSRLVFLFCTGLLPKHVDHRNRITTDDRPCNLRAADSTLNAGNMIRKKKSGLLKGVHFRLRRYQNPFGAQITINGIKRWLGAFPTEELAHAAYCAAARKHFGEFARFS